MSQTLAPASTRAMRGSTFPHLSPAQPRFQVLRAEPKKSRIATVTTARTVLALAAVAVFGTLVNSVPSSAEPRASIAMHGEAALPDTFAHFPYVNPDAPKGGRVTLGVQGSFDSLNPLIVRGEPVQGMREFVFESLMSRSQDEPFTLYGLIAESIDVPDDRSEVTFTLNRRRGFPMAALSRSTT